MQDLPLEILFYIIDRLLLHPPKLMQSSESPDPDQADNREELWACARVSRAFRDRAYSRLFETVVLEVWLLGRRMSIQKSIAQLDKAADMLSASPNRNIVRHIKSFCLFVTTNPFRSTNSSPIQDFIHEGCLHEIFDALHGNEHGIESFSFVVACDLGPWEYSAGPEEFKRAFAALVRSRHLKHVQLCGINKVPKDIFYSPEIQRVELYGMRFDVELGELSLLFSLGSIGMDVPPNLGLDESPEAFQVVTPASKWELAQIYCRAKSADSMVKVIQFADHIYADTLRKFYVQISGTDFSSASPASGGSSVGKTYHFCRFKQLTTLRISEIVGREVLNVLRCFLQQCSIPSKLSELTLDTVIHLGNESEAATLPHPERWRRLSQLLTHPTSKFSGIPKIVIIVNFNATIMNPSSDHSAFEARMLESLRMNLSEFTAAGMGGRVRDVEIRSVFPEVGHYAAGPKNSVLVRYGRKGILRIPSNPNTS